LPHWIYFPWTRVDGTLMVATRGHGRKRAAQEEGNDNMLYFFLSMCSLFN
jgi:hypothetical protein